MKLRFLTERDCARIHETALAILETVGVRVHHERSRALLVERGAQPHPTAPEALRLPARLVREAIAMAPKAFAVTDRAGRRYAVENGAASMVFTGNGLHYQPGVGPDIAPIMTRDFAEFCRVAEACSNIHGVVAPCLHDVPPTARDVMGLVTLLENSTKHLRPCVYSPAGAEYFLEMAQVVAGGKLRENMFLSMGYSCVSPLTWSHAACELFWCTAGRGVPMMLNSEPMAGGTSPVTLAGSLALADAEVLSGLVLLQAIEEGRPAIYNAGFAHVLEMKTLLTLTGAAENALLQSAGAQMAVFHGLPSAAWSLTDSCMTDAQAVAEKQGMLLSHLLSGVNFVWGAGNLETSRTISPVNLVIDDALAGWAARVGRGITVDAEHLALEVIQQAGFEGRYLENEHTLDNYLEEIDYPALPNRHLRAAWQDKGSKSMEQEAAGRVTDILAAPAVPLLDEATSVEIHRLAKAWMASI